MRGTVKVGDEVEIVGLMDEARKTVVTGVEMFRKLLDEAVAGDNIGCLLRGIQRTEVERTGRRSWLHQASYSLQGTGLRPDQGRRRKAYSVLQRLQASVLLQDH